MRQLIAGVLLALLSAASWALSPYISGDKQAAADVGTQLAQAERRLQAEGFAVVGRHLPKGLPQHGSLVVTDRALLDAVRHAGGVAIVGAGLRVGVKSDGTVTYMNPEYWYRAYLRAGFDAAQPAVRSAQQRLAKALGAGAGFGGDVPAAELADYRYMFGMERIDSLRNELRSFANFDEALRTVQDNLAKSVAGTAKVYEVVMPERRLAVIGVALNDAEQGEAWWAGKIGPDHVAALPYEIYIVDGKVYALYARYRIALSWPALGMGQFMTIVRAPDVIHATMGRLAGVSGP
jgi:hypothetical protein